MLEPPGAVPNGFAAPGVVAVEPNNLGVEDAEGAGAFAPPNREDGPELAPGWVG